MSVAHRPFLLINKSSSAVTVINFKAVVISTLIWAVLRGTLTTHKLESNLRKMNITLQAYDRKTRDLLSWQIVSNIARWCHCLTLTPQEYSAVKCCSRPQHSWEHRLVVTSKELPFWTTRFRLKFNQSSNNCHQVSSILSKVTKLILKRMFSSLIAALNNYPYSNNNNNNIISIKIFSLTIWRSIMRLKELIIHHKRSTRI